MHIVTAAHDIYPDPGSGGSGRFVYETSRRLAARGHRVSVVTRRRGDGPEREILGNVSIYRFDLEIAGRNLPEIVAQLPSTLAAVGRHVSAATRAATPDLLSAQGPVATWLAAHHLDDRIPRVATFHSPWPTEYQIRTRRERTAPRRRVNEAIRWHIERAVLSSSSRVITLSTFMQEMLNEVYCLDVDAEVIPGGVDAMQYTPAAAADDSVITGDPAFLTVRRLAARMGHELLLEAFTTVVEHYPGARLYLAGDGPLRSRLEQTAASLGIDDRVTFLGYVPDQVLPSVYAAADVFVLPTTELEGFGLATLEALASGTPVLGTPVGGTVEVLSGLADELPTAAPVLLPSVNIASLADGMIAWAERSAEEMAAAEHVCRRFARRRYTWEQTTSAIEATYADHVL